MGHNPVGGIDGGKERQRQRQNDACRRASQADSVGDDPGIDVGESANQKQSGEDEVSRQSPCESVLQEDGNEKQRGEKLDQGIADAELGMAGSAASAEDKITENRDVIVPLDECAAGIAIRSGQGEILRGGKPIDADIEETAKAGSQQEEKSDVNGIKVQRDQVRNGDLPRCRIVSARFHASPDNQYHAHLAFILQVSIFQWGKTNP